MWQMRSLANHFSLDRHEHMTFLSFKSKLFQGTKHRLILKSQSSSFLLQNVSAQPWKHFFVGGGGGIMPLPISNRVKDYCQDALWETCIMLVKLGFVINSNKSTLIPTQILEFVGFILNTLPQYITNKNYTT